MESGATPAPADAPTVSARISEDAVRSGAARVLFIGDSLTYYNGGLDEYLRSLAGIVSHRVVAPGAPLSQLWRSGPASSTIAREKWDVVVIQEDLPETRRKDFRRFGEEFVRAARGARAKPLLLMTWAYERLPSCTQQDIASAHAQLGHDLNVPVVPAGLAFERAARCAPQIGCAAAPPALWRDLCTSTPDPCSQDVRQGPRAPEPGGLVPDHADDLGRAHGRRPSLLRRRRLAAFGHGGGRGDGAAGCRVGGGGGAGLGLIPIGQRYISLSSC